MDWLAKFMPLLVALAVLAVNAFMAWVCWSMRQLAKTEVERIVAAAVEKLQAADKTIGETVDDHADRLLILEKGFEALPQQDDFRRLEAALAEVSKGQARSDATLVSVKESNVATQNAVDRLYRYMLERDKK